jgi:hypothetical protein
MALQNQLEQVTGAQACAVDGVPSQPHHARVGGRLLERLLVFRVICGGVIEFDDNVFIIVLSFSVVRLLLCSVGRLLLRGLIGARIEAFDTVSEPGFVAGFARGALA